MSTVERIVAEDPDFPPRDALRGPLDMSGIDLVMLGHAHIDLGYRWDIQETIHRICPDTFRGVLEAMEHEPRFTFCQSQMFLYDAMERSYPDLYRAIRERIREGRWEVVGGAWCEYDTALPCGEAVIRQHLQGMRYAEEHLGVKESGIGFVPDSFIAHAATLPQILSGCGIRWYLFGRGLPGGTRRAFRWEGPDGSSVVAYLPFGPYSNPPFTPEHLERLKPYADAATGTCELALYGAGDHGGGPREADIGALHALHGIPGSPRWRYGSAASYFREAFPEEKAAALERRSGSLRSFASGALTSQAPTKRANRLCEHLLLRTEALASIATTLQRKPAHPRVDFGRLWRELLTLQFHDILPGTSVRSVYRQAARAYAALRAGTEELLGDALERIRSRIDTTGEGLPLLVVNPGLGPVCGIVRAARPPWIEGGRYRLVDDSGAQVPSQWDAEGLSFLAALPSLSWRLYRAHPERGIRPPRRRSREQAVTELTRGAFKLGFDATTGVFSIADRKGRPVVASAGAMELWEEEEQSTSWVQVFTGRLVGLEVAESSHLLRRDRLASVVRTVFRSACSRIIRDVWVYEEIAAVDILLAIDWRESDAFLKLRFAVPERPGPSSPVIRSSLAHGFEQVVEPEREFCMHDWVDVHDGETGIALITDGAYGADFTERGLGISVIRSARDMDPTMAHGAHELRIRLLPYRGAWSQARLLDAAASFATPLAAAWDSHHRGGLMEWGSIDNTRSLPPRGSFLSIEGEGLRLCALKLPEEHYTADAFVIRLRETEGAKSRGKLHLPLPCSSLWAADHLERPLHVITGEHGASVGVELGPYEIRTYLAYL